MGEVVITLCPTVEYPTDEVLLLTGCDWVWSLRRIVYPCPLAMGWEACTRLLLGTAINVGLCAAAEDRIMS